MSEISDAFKEMTDSLAKSAKKVVKEATNIYDTVAEKVSASVNVGKGNNVTSSFQSGGTTTVTQNGKTVTVKGGNVVIKNGEMFVDGKKVTPDGCEDKECVYVTVMIDGDCNKVSTESGNVTVEGASGSVTTMSGDVDIQGAGVSGNVETMSGDIDINGAVGGKVSTMSGDVSHK